MLIIMATCTQPEQLPMTQLLKICIFDYGLIVEAWD